MDNYIPAVSPQLIAHLRKNRREWRNEMPPANWSHDQIQRAIGANEVLLHLEELLAKQMGTFDEDE